MSTYHQERPEYLDRALTSIWTEQTRRPDEIIMVEDGVLGSALEQRIKTWENTDCPLKVIRHKEHKGLADCLNDAIAHAEGDYLARMDSDDISLPNRLELQEKYLDEHPNVCILGGSLEEFNDAGTLHFIRNYPATQEKVLRSMYKASPVGHPSVMFRRRIFDYGLRYINNFKMCEDVSLWFDAVAEGFEINNLQTPILRFRRNEDMISRRSRQKAVGEFLAYIRGIRKVYGIFTMHVFYSYLRFVFRLMPQRFIRCMYSSKIRNCMA